MALSLPEVCGVLLGTLGAWLDLFLQTEKQGIQAQIPQKVFINNNIVCLQEVHGKDEFLQASQVLAPRFRVFLLPSFLETKMQEDRLSAFTEILNLKKLL